MRSSSNKCKHVCTSDKARLVFHREKMQGVEAKLRSTIQDKASVQSEKANIERQLKTLQAQTGKLTKVVSTAVAFAAMQHKLAIRACRGGFIVRHGPIHAEKQTAKHFTNVPLVTHLLPSCQSEDYRKQISCICKWSSEEY